VAAQLSAIEIRITGNGKEQSDIIIEARVHFTHLGQSYSTDIGHADMQLTNALSVHAQKAIAALYDHVYAHVLEFGVIAPAPSAKPGPEAKAAPVVPATHLGRIQYPAEEMNRG
jgi:hypothetical protein